MRKIKFRAWVENSFDKYMDYEPTLHVGHGTSVFINDAIKENQKPLMQYTGLKDKNGTEIYEGDIVEDLYESKKYKVVWHRDGFKLQIKNRFGELFYVPIYGDSYKIIGNIYEHPHLLEAST